ncbi:hypothetical protein HY418_00090 [Candidatus Kaiserbacteria bacterium]|nr:hypothetical protein [Candidatus Kaiserbacteria bacterium]
MNGISDVMNRFVTYIIDPAILVVFSLGFFLFVYGLVEFLWKLNEGGDNKEGKQHMIWGIIGMLIMVSVYGILSLVTNTFGIDLQNPDTTTPLNINVGSSFQ